MEAINDIKQKFLTYPRPLLCFLFLMTSFNWHDSSDPISDNITTIVNLFGEICLLIWYYSAGEQLNKTLHNNGIELKIFNYFNLGFIIIICSAVAKFLISEGKETFGGSMFQITYTEPLELSLISFFATVMTCWILAKTLVSAEQNQEATFDDCFKTFLLFLFSWIGVWWLQPRVQKLSAFNEEH